MAPALDPTLSALQTSLDNALAAGKTVPLTDATLGTPGAAVLALFTAQLGSTPVVFGAAPVPTIVADTTNDALVVTGVADATLLGIANPLLQATFTAAAGVLSVVMTITTTSGWTLTTSFPNLGLGYLGSLQFGGAAPFFTLRSSDGPPDAFGPVLTAGLNLTITPTLESPFDLLKIVIPSLPTSVTFAGPAAISATLESVSLRAASVSPPTLSIAHLVTLGFIDVTPVLSAISTPDVSQNWQSGGSFGVWGHVLAGGTTLPLAIDVGIGVMPFTIGLVPGSSVTFAQLAGMLQSVPVLDMLPAALKSLNALPITAFSVQFAHDLTSLLGVSLAVASAKATPLNWTIIPGVLALEDVALSLSLSPDPNGGWQYSGSAAADLKLATVTVGLSIGLPIGSQPWLITSSPGIDLPGLGELAQLLGGQSLSALLPAKLGDIGAFTLERLDVVINTSPFGVASVHIILASTNPWTIIDGVLVVEQPLTIDIVVATPFSSPAITGKVAGTIEIGSNTVALSVSREGAQLDWMFSLKADGIVVDLGDLARLAGSDVNQFLPASLADQAKADGVTITELSLDVDLSTRQLTDFSMSVSTNQSWTIVDGYLVLESLTVDLNLDRNSGTLYTTGSIQGYFNLDDGAAYIFLGAAYLGPQHWVFSGGTVPGTVINLSHIVEQLLGISLPSELPDFTLTDVLMSFDSSDKSYSFAASTADPWKITLTSDINFAVTGSVAVQRDATGQYSGKLAADIKGHFASENLDLQAVYAFQPSGSSLGFVLTFRGIVLSCTRTKSGADTILTVHLGNLSFGEIVEYLVNLADPSLDFQLSSPWTVLNDINFDALSLTINLTQKTVGIVYALNKDLVLVDIKTIGLTYTKRDGQGTVDIAFTGSFAGANYDQNNPLSWDLLNDPAPTPPGAGAALFDLEYVGIGQHVALVDPSMTTMPAVLKDLKATVTGTGGDPWKLLVFDRSSGWLFGAQFTIMDTLEIGLVFNDPNLYGLQITLSGDKAEIFKGLYFEILYRKISDDIGVYHIELKLPDVMRHLEFGEVSITLPVIIIDIYTNGNFKVDFGFPVNGDFTNSFSIEVFPFVGFGGFYFALLSGATSSRVPKISNGTFNPVIEFGVGLSIGVGKDFSEGPLSAGVSVTVLGILEGAIGWFNPSDKSVPADKYYWIQGTIGIVGKLYGSVDFVIIKASLSLVATATATLVIEAFQPIFIELSVSVEVEASVKIVFITIHFSFSMGLDVSFTIGSASTPPWTLAPGGGSGNAPARTLAQQRRHIAQRKVVRAQRFAAFAAASPRALNTAPVWPPAPLLANAPVPVPLWMTGCLTVGGATPSVQAVMTLLAPNGMPTDGTWPAPGSTSFDLLAEAALLWAINSQIGQITGNLSQVDLHDLAAALADDTLRATAFSYDNISNFLAANFVFAISDNGASQTSAGAGVFPMPPALVMAAAGQSIDFSAKTPVDDAYQHKLQAYFAQLSVNYTYNVATHPDDAGANAAPPPPEPTESLATVIFRDYFLMLTKSAVQAAEKLFAAFPHPITSADSLISVANAFSAPVAYTVQQGDTLYTIAAELDVPVAAIEQSNPSVGNAPLVAGTVLSIPPRIADAEYVSQAGDTDASIGTAFAVDPAAIRAANPLITNWANLAANTLVLVPVPALMLAIAEANMNAQILQPGVVLSLRGMTYAVQATDTLASVTQAFDLSSAGDLAALNAAATMLQPQATLQIGSAASGNGSFPYTAQSGDTLASVAAYFFVRNAEPVADPNFGWFANTITANNPNIPYVPASPAAPTTLDSVIVTGTTLAVPNAELTDKGISIAGSALSYVTRPGDTLGLVAGYFLMMQIDAAQLATLEAAIQALNPSIVVGTPITPGTTVAIPPLAHSIARGETLAGLAALFGLAVADLGTYNAGNAILAPHYPLALTAVSYSVVATDTLASIAAAHGLTVDALAGRIAAVTGLLTSANLSPPPTLTIPHAPQVAISELVATFLATRQPNGISGIVSRFQMHGLQIPTPETLEPHVATNLAAVDPNGFAPLYELTGAQFAAPAAPFQVTFTTNANPQWLGFSPAGSSLAVSIGSNAVQPSLAFDAGLTGPPARLPLAAESPVRHTLTAHAPWQSATPLPFAAPPASGASVPSLWFFPAALLDRLGRDPMHPYQLCAGTTAEATLTATAVAAYDWASFLPLRIRQVNGPAGTPLADTFVVDGADQDGRTLLSGIIDYGTANPNDAPQLWLLYSASPASATPSGYVSDAVDPAATMLLQTNLSTLTHSGVGPLAAPMLLEAIEAPPPPPTYYAPLGSGGDFVRLLWEASIVGSGGYYLRYQTTAKAGLPAAVFANGNEATIWLVAVLQSQSSGNNPDLYGFSNCAVLRDAIDPQRLNLFAETTDGSDMTLASTVPPGNVGFTMSRPNPNPAGGATQPPTPEQLTQSLFSLLDYELPAPPNTAFAKSVVTLPAGPVGNDASQWVFQGVVPAYRLAVQTMPQLHAAFPAAGDDPYAGVAAGAEMTLRFDFRDVFGNELDASPAIADLSLPVGYTDTLLGLSSWPNATGHYSFASAQGSGVPQVNGAVELELSTYVPGPTTSVDSTLAKAAGHLLKYRQVWYQLRQPDVAFAVATSFDRPGAGPTKDPDAHRALANFVTAACLFLDTVRSLKPVLYTVATTSETPQSIATAYSVTLPQLFAANAGADVSQLFATDPTIPQYHRALATDALADAVSGTAVTVQALLVQNATLPLSAGVALRTAALTYTTAAGDSLASIAALLAVAIDDIATANQATPGLLAQGVVVAIGTTTVTIGGSDSFTTLVQAFAAQGVETTVVAIAAANAAVAGIFRPATPIAIAESPTTPGDSSGQRSVKVAATDSADSIARANRCTVGGLAAANAQTANILGPATISVQGVTVPVVAGDTLAALVAKFQALSLNVSVADIVGANQTLVGLFATGAALVVPDYVIGTDTTGKGQTLNAVIAASSSFSAAILAARNPTGPQGIFPAGTPLYLGATTAQRAPGVTLAILARQAGISLDQLAIANAATMLLQIAVLEIPSAIALDPTQTSPFTAYVAADGATVGSIATAWGQTSGIVAQSNPTTPNLFVAGVAIAYPGHALTTEAGDDFTTLAGRAGAPDVATFASDPSVSGLAGLLAPGALLVRSNFYQATGADPLATIASDWGWTPGDLAAANALVPGLFTVGTTIAYPEQTVVTMAGDTFASLARRAGAPDVASFAGDASVNALSGLVAANALFAQGPPLVGKNVSFGGLATACNLAIEDIAGANAALVGLIAAGAQFTVSGQTLTAGSFETLQSLIYRFANLATPITTSAVEIAQLNDAGPVLNATSPFLVPPGAALFAIDLAQPYIPGPIFPLRVDLVTTRDPSLVDPEFAGVADVVGDETPLAPLMPQASGSPAGVQDFASTFETTFANWKLKLATGPRASDEPSGGRPLWVADFGAGGFSDVAVADGAAALYYALAPIDTTLVAGTANVPDYNASSGTLGDAVKKSFSGIDLDLWLQQLLVAIDTFLGPQYAVPALIADAPSFDAVVAAKGVIAGYLAGQVLPILDAPAPQPSPQQLAAACEALRQSMLVTLESGFTTDALVQLPVAVTSPFSAGYTTGATDGFAELAAYYGVDPGAVADALALLPGLLDVGATVSAGQASHQIAAGDTLASLAAALGIAVEQLPAQISVSGGALFASDVAIDASVLAYAPAADDTPAAAAGWLGASLAGLALANQSLPAIFRNQAPLQLGTATYTVQQNDTLLMVAAALNSTPAGVLGGVVVTDGGGLFNPATTLRAFSSGQQSAPRLSGKPTIRVYVSPTASGLADLQAYYGVSNTTLAAALWTMPRILNQNARVTYQGNSATIAAADTLSSLAGKLGQDPDTANAGFVQALGGALFAPRTTIGLTRVDRSPGTADSFATLAAFFGQEPADVATANQDVPDILVAGTSFTIGSVTYKVQSGDTLVAVGKQFDLSAGDFAETPSIAVMTGIFNPIMVLNGLAEMPDCTFSTAKAPLSNGGSLLTVLFSTASDARFRNVFAAVDYAVNEVEFDIAAVPGIVGYQASNWLTFVNPITTANGPVDGDVGLLDIPVPLRTYPAEPVLVSQSGKATNPDASTIATAKQWDFSFAYSHQDAAQDTPYVEISFNDPQAGGPPTQAPQFSAARITSDAWLAALAPFVSVYPRLQSGLAQLLQPGVAATAFGKAVVQSFATLVGGVAAALSGPSRVMMDALAGDGTLPFVSYTFEIRYTIATDVEQHYEALDLLLVDSTGDAPRWPEIAVRFPEGPGSTFQPLTQLTPGTNSTTYQFTQKVPAFNPMSVQFTLSGLDIIQLQSAWGGVYLTRNEHLVTNVGLDQPATNSAFVYQTPLVRFSDPVLPSIANTAIIPIGQGSESQFGAALVTALGSILDLQPPYTLTAQYGLKCALLYGHTLRPPLGDDPGIVSYVPVTLVPDLTVDASSSIADFAASLQAFLDGWLGTYGPALSDGDVLALEMTLRATPPAAPRPLLSLARLVFTLQS